MTNTVRDKYKEGHIEEDINREKDIKSDIYQGGYMEVDIHITGGDTLKEKHIRRKTYEEGYTWKKHIDGDIHRWKYI